MNKINWFLIIYGFILAIIGTYLLLKNCSSIGVMFVFSGGFHIGQGLYEEDYNA